MPQQGDPAESTESPALFMAEAMPAENDCVFSC